PEWRYFGEQSRKAERLAELGAAVNMAVWPGDFAGWQAVLEKARELDVRALAELYSADAAQHAAEWLEDCVDRLWAGALTAQTSSRDTDAKRQVAELASRVAVSEETQP
ncbi:hypothetical protein OEZ77_26210, partial [Leclercia adecarboxylata]|uniref:hypothetical protein n=1 Tax=Leclercia adecarboxylata TaxID=83655 RepID=UPI00234DDDFD